MSASTAVFRLFRYDPCGHELLLRVRRPGASNADQGAVDAADDFADSITDHLRAWWERRLLPRECRRHHTSGLIAEAEEPPLGDELFGPGLRRLAVWTARTAAGAPWVVLGGAPTESEFWRSIEDDPDLVDLGPRAPADLHDAYFLTDEVGRQDLSTL